MGSSQGRGEDGAARASAHPEGQCVAVHRQRVRRHRHRQRDRRGDKRAQRRERTTSAHHPGPRKRPQQVGLLLDSQRPGVAEDGEPHRRRHVLHVRQGRHRAIGKRPQQGGHLPAGSSRPLQPSGQAPGTVGQSDWPRSAASTKSRSRELVERIEFALHEVVGVRDTGTNPLIGRVAMEVSWIRSRPRQTRPCWKRSGCTAVSCASRWARSSARWLAVSRGAQDLAAIVRCRGSPGERTRADQESRR
jgi:hypothetical protein